MADGSLYMTLRSRNERRCRGWSRSRDGGATWSAVAYEPALPELGESSNRIENPSCQGSIVRLDDGRILMAHPSKPDERAELVLRLSADQGRSWPIERECLSRVRLRIPIWRWIPTGRFCVYTKPSATAACAWLALSRCGLREGLNGIGNVMVAEVKQVQPRFRVGVSLRSVRTSPE